MRLLALPAELYPRHCYSLANLAKNRAYFNREDGKCQAYFSCFLKKFAKGGGAPQNSLRRALAEVI